MGLSQLIRFLQKASAWPAIPFPVSQERRGPSVRSLVEGTNARFGSRIKDYKGKAKTVPDYIMESIVEPSAYVVKAFPDNTMPKVFGQKLSAGALKKIVDYLSQVKEGKAPPKIS